MVLNRLKLNQDKTELLLISSRYRQSLALSYLQVGEEKICPSKSVRNLGVHFDQHTMMHVYVKNVCQGSFYHLRNISKIRRYLSQDTTEILIHAYITSKLDNCNSLLYGLPTYMINKLQSIQNAAGQYRMLLVNLDLDDLKKARYPRMPQRLTERVLMFSLCCYRRQETSVNLGLFQTNSNYSWFLCFSCYGFS